MAPVISATAAAPVPTGPETPKSAVVAPTMRIQRSIEEYRGFITFIFSVSIFGASTFAVIVGQMADPTDIWKPDAPPFNLGTVRKFLAIAWLCFILSIAVAGYSSSILTIWREGQADFYAPAGWKRWNALGIVASTLMHLLIVTAFLFLSLALVAYVGTVAWVAVGFVTLAGLFVVSLSAVQFMYVGRSYVPSSLHILIQG